MPMKIILTVEKGAHMGTIHDISGIAKIGRGLDCDIQITDDMVSNSHAEIKPVGDLVYLADLESQNGTRLNGHLITKEIPIYSGDKITVGNHVFLVKILQDDGKTLDAPLLDKRFHKNKDSFKKLFLRSIYGFAFVLIIIGGWHFFLSENDNENATIERYWKAATNYYSQGLYNDALVELEVALAVEPRNQKVITLIEDTRKLVRVDKIYQEAILLSKNENIKELERAILKFEEVQRLNPDYKEYSKHKTYVKNKLNSYSVILKAKNDFSNKRYDMAIKKIKSVLAQFPENKLALAYLENYNQAKRLRIEHKKNRDRIKKSQTKPKNKPPEITQILLDKYTLTTGEQISISTIVLDPDDDVISFEWSAKYGSIAGKKNEVTYHAPSEVPDNKSDLIIVKVKDGKGGVASRSINLTINAPKPKVLLTDTQRRKAKKFFIEGYRSEKEPTIRNIPLAISYYKKVLEIAPDPNFIYYKKAVGRLSNLESKLNE